MHYKCTCLKENCGMQLELTYPVEYYFLNSQCRVASHSSVRIGNGGGIILNLAFQPLRLGSHGKFVLPRKVSASQILLANSGHPTAVAV